MTWPSFLDALIWIILHSAIENLLGSSLVLRWMEVWLKAIRCRNVDECSWVARVRLRLPGTLLAVCDLRRTNSGLFTTPCTVAESLLVTYCLKHLVLFLLVIWNLISLWNSWMLVALKQYQPLSIYLHWSNIADEFLHQISSALPKLRLAQISKLTRSIVIDDQLSPTFDISQSHDPSDSPCHYYSIEFVVAFWASKLLHKRHHVSSIVVSAPGLLDFDSTVSDVTVEQGLLLLFKALMSQSEGPYEFLNRHLLASIVSLLEQASELQMTSDRWRVPAYQVSPYTFLNQYCCEVLKLVTLPRRSIIEIVFWIVSECCQHLLANIDLKVLRTEPVLIFQYANTLLIEVFEHLVGHLAIYRLLKHPIHMVLLLGRLRLKVTMHLGRQGQIQWIIVVICVKALGYGLLDYGLLRSLLVLHEQSRNLWSWEICGWLLLV